MALACTAAAATAAAAAAAAALLLLLQQHQHWYGSHLSAAMCMFVHTCMCTSRWHMKWHLLQQQQQQHWYGSRLPMCISSITALAFRLPASAAVQASQH
eukprot:364081-Chlamydomonas_euryale.AAC.1